jgi:hypothetical protein
MNAKFNKVVEMIGYAIISTLLGTMFSWWSTIFMAPESIQYTVLVITSTVCFATMLRLLRN